MRVAGAFSRPMRPEREVVSFGLISVALALAAGAAVSVNVRAAAIGVVLCCLTGIAVGLGLRAAWGAFVVALGGLLVLGYGFANVPAIPGAPVPLTDVLLVVVCLVALVTGPLPSREVRFPFALALALASLMTIRLAADVGTWGRLAFRDYTLAVELTALPVGYWTLRRFGLERWLRSLRWIFVCAVVYVLLYPLADELAARGPVVGLQQPVPLLGSYSGASTAAAAGLFFFAFLRPIRRLTIALVVVSAAAIVLKQSRGLYIAIPLSLLVTALLSSAGAAHRLRRAVVVCAIAAVVALGALSAAGWEGRLGKVTPSLVVEQLQSLRGTSAPGSGVDARQTWFAQTLDFVGEQRVGWLTGVGLGPDLAFGFEPSGGVLARKPHDDYLEAYARLGALGLVLLVALIVKPLALIVSAARRLDGDRALFLWWVVATSLVYAFIAATQPLLAFPYGTIPLFAFLGAGLAVVEEARRPGIGQPVRVGRP